MKAAWPVLTCVVILSACGSGSDAAHPQSVPSATAPGGAVASILCRTHRVEIQSDEHVLTLDQSAGDEAAAAALRIKIRAAIAAARAIPGCNVDDLVLP